MALLRSRVSLISPLRSFFNPSIRFFATREVEILPKMDPLLEQDPNFQIGKCMPLAMMRIGTIIHSLEMRPGQGPKFVRAAGTRARIISEPSMVERYCIIELPSKERKLIDKRCKATVALPSIHVKKKLYKAGQNRWRGIRPTVRGVAMNPVDHPHGGGEGRSKSSGSHGKTSRTPWGKPTKCGYKRPGVKKRKKAALEKLKKM